MYLRRLEAAEDPTAESEELPLIERMRERLAFGLRLLVGVAWTDAVRQQWLRHDPAVHAQIQRLQDLALLRSDQHRLRLSPRGLMLADSVASRLLIP